MTPPASPLPPQTSEGVEALISAASGPQMSMIRIAVESMSPDYLSIVASVDEQMLARLWREYAALLAALRQLVAERDGMRAREEAARQWAATYAKAAKGDVEAVSGNGLTPNREIFEERMDFLITLQHMYALLTAPVSPSQSDETPTETRP